MANLADAVSPRAAQAHNHKKGGNESVRRGLSPRVPISQSNSFIGWFPHLTEIEPVAEGSSTQTRNDDAWGNDFKTHNFDAVEMVVTCDQDVSAAVFGELDQAIVTPIRRHQPRWIDWIWEQEGFLFNATAEFINLIRSDCVST